MRIESNKAGIQPSALLVLPMLVAASTASAESITFTDQPSGPLVPFTQAGFDIEPFGTSSTDIIATGPTPPALAETTHYGSSSTRITMTEGGLFELAQRDYRAPGFPLDWVTVEGYVDGALVATQDAPDGSGTLANPLGLPVDEIRISLSTELAGDASVDNIELLPFTDCNANDINDITELEEGDSDCNNNGLLDECEPIITHDCCEVSQSAGCSDSAIAACVCGFDPFCCQTQWDQICVDNVDKFACGTCQAGVFDCNNNLLPDSCEVAEVDCNNNGVPDDCDTDSDNDGAPDACDVCPGGDDALDADSDGLADACDNCPGYSNGPNTTIFDQVSVQIDVGPAGGFKFQAFLAATEGELTQVDVGRIDDFGDPLEFAIYAGPDPGAPVIYFALVDIPAVAPGEWSSIVLDTPVAVNAGSAYTWSICCGSILMLGDYPVPGMDSSLGPNLDYAFQTHVRPVPQTDADGDGAGDPCDFCPATVPGAVVDEFGCPPVLIDDFDRDGDVDYSDLVEFGQCALGPGALYPDQVVCELGDEDQDDDIDLRDFAAYQRCFSGTDVPGACLAQLP